MPAVACSVRGKKLPTDAAMYTDVRRAFELGEPREANPSMLLDESRWTLWSLDFERQAAVFVESPAGTDLLGGPFLYLEQYRHARQVAWLDLPAFHSMAERHAVSRRGLVWLYSTGRCGSTLLHRILARSPSIVSISEADAFTTLATQRGAYPSTELRKLVRSTVAWLTYAFGDASQLLAFKHRLETCAIWEAMGAIDDARSVFLYRNAIDFVESMDRTAGHRHARRQWMLRILALRSATRTWRRYRLSQRSAHDVTAERSLAMLGSSCSALDVELDVGWCGWALLSWLSSVGAYLEARRREQPLVALRYEDLTADPVGLVTHLLAFLGCPTSEAPTICTDVHGDAQAGTSLASMGTQKRRLDARTRNAITRILATTPSIGEASVILPGTLRAVAAT